MRSYDKIVGFVHFNPKTGHLFVSLANSGLFVMFDIPTKKIVWNIPKVEKDRPLCAYSDQDKLIVAYDSNKILVFDLLNHKLHDWSRRNPPSTFPPNFLNRFNRIVGLTCISPSKYLLYTHYTYILLDLLQDVPADEVQIVQNHPGKSIGEKSLSARSWFDNLKLSQGKYLKKASEVIIEAKTTEESSVQNLTISNKLKGILSMSYQDGKLTVVENSWKKLVEAFPGAVAIPKYGQ